MDRLPTLEEIEYRRKRHADRIAARSRLRATACWQLKPKFTERPLDLPEEDQNDKKD